MLSGYADNHTGGTSHMFNLCPKRIILIHDIIWLGKTYYNYISIQEHTKDESYITQDEDNSNKWAHVKNFPVKTENTNIKKNIKTDQDYRGEKT